MGMGFGCCMSDRASNVECRRSACGVGALFSGAETAICAMPAEVPMRSASVVLMTLYMVVPFPTRR
jgi:hypothetical protein